jgi:hypothetical protein
MQDDRWGATERSRPGYPPSPGYYGSMYGPPPYSPPPYMPPGPPERRRPKIWRWIGIGVGITLLLCVGGTVAVVAMNGTASSPGSASAGPQNSMTLGTDYQESGNSFTIVGSKNSFTSKDSIAYVIVLSRAIGVTQEQLSLVKLEGNGVESPVFSQAVPIPNPSDNELANKIPSLGDLMSLYGAGSGQYRLEISNGTSILAEADFAYTAA